jgi:hypothetical protein
MGCWVRVNCVPVTVNTKLRILRQSLCVATGHRATCEMLNTVPTPEDPEVKACDDPRLVELAMRYYLWSNSGSNWDPTLQETLNVAEARVALQKHLQSIEKM